MNYLFMKRFSSKEINSAAVKGSERERENISGKCTLTQSIYYRKICKNKLHSLKGVK